MATQRLIVAIGRIERALSRLEQMPQPSPAKIDDDLAGRHEKLKAETRAAIGEIDRILGGAV
jgi:phage host-nuclease inhibitor protein Gam